MRAPHTWPAGVRRAILAAAITLWVAATVGALLLNTIGA